jgi:HAD superfamily hydrolase (TIGR01549 family)
MPLILENVRWVFFDLGYTLINEDGAAFGRLQQVCDSLGELGVDTEVAELVKGLEEASAHYDPSPFVSVLNQLVPDPKHQDFVRKSGRYLKELEKPYPDAEPLLVSLAGKYQLGVIANQPKGTEARLKDYGLLSFFSVCISSTELGIAKPDPKIFRVALREAGCRPEEAVMIGDRIDNDIKPAKALGMQTVRILQGLGRLQRPRTDDEQPDATARNLAELREILFD